jgi:hypothetical protein
LAKPYQGELPKIKTYWELRQSEEITTSRTPIHMWWRTVARSVSRMVNTPITTAGWRQKCQDLEAYIQEQRRLAQLADNDALLMHAELEVHRKRHALHQDGFATAREVARLQDELGRTTKERDGARWERDRLAQSQKHMLEAWESLFTSTNFQHDPAFQRKMFTVRKQVEAAIKPQAKPESEPKPAKKPPRRRRISGAV